MSVPIKIGLVAGESSGDQLGGALIPALKVHLPNAVFEGIGGDKMLAQGFDSLFPLERLSVMGLIDPLKRLPELLRIRKQLYRHFLTNQFDLVLGIDSPDFNLGLERKLRQKGIKTAHYVSPSVWAWRQNRVKKIALSVDHMLTLFPFEAEFFRQHSIPVTCVGHPLADQIPEKPDPQQARNKLGLVQAGTLVALMPGSRHSEIEMMGELFLQVANYCRKQLPDIQFVLPASSKDRLMQLQALLAQHPDLPIHLLDGQSHLAMEASDAVLLTSGTTALEAMLLKKPMVVSYKMSGLSYQIISRMLKTPYISLPNLLADKPLVPELIQHQATTEAIGEKLLAFLRSPNQNDQLIEAFDEMHQKLRSNGAAQAAQTLAGLIKASK